MYIVSRYVVRATAVQSCSLSRGQRSISSSCSGVSLRTGSVQLPIARTSSYRFTRYRFTRDSHVARFSPALAANLADRHPEYLVPLLTSAEGRIVHPDER